MDFRFYAVVALVIAIMEIVSRIAKKGQEREDTGSTGAEPGGGLLRRLEEMALSGESGEARSPKRGDERAVVARAVVEPRRRAAQAAPQIEASTAGDAAEKTSDRPSLGEAFLQSLQSFAREEPGPSSERAPELRVVADDGLEGRLDDGEADVGRESRRVKGDALPPRSAARPGRSAKTRPRLPELYTTRGLRRLVVARELLGPPLALREQGHRRQGQ